MKKVKITKKSWVKSWLYLRGNLTVELRCHPDHYVSIWDELDRWIRKAPDTGSGEVREDCVMFSSDPRECLMFLDHRPIDHLVVSNIVAMKLYTDSSIQED